MDRKQEHREYNKKRITTPELRQTLLDCIKARQQRIKEWLQAKKQTLKCCRCSENFWGCLDFHHLDPNTKDKEISKVVRDGWSIPRIELEITKCIVLCANCHRKQHMYLDGKVTWQEVFPELPEPSNVTTASTT